MDVTTTGSDGTMIATGVLDQQFAIGGPSGAYQPGQLAMGSNISPGAGESSLVSFPLPGDNEVTNVPEAPWKAATCMAIASSSNGLKP
jgi:hypothetical protein